MKEETTVLIAALEKAVNVGDSDAVRMSLFGSLAMILTERVAVKLLLAPKDDYPPEVADFIDSFAKFVLDWQRQHI